MIQTYSAAEKEILQDVDNTLIAAASAFAFYTERLMNAAAKLRTLAKEETK